MTGEVLEHPDGHAGSSVQRLRQEGHVLANDPHGPQLQLSGGLPAHAAGPVQLAPSATHVRLDGAERHRGAILPRRRQRHPLWLEVRLPLWLEVRLPL